MNEKEEIEEKKEKDKEELSKEIEDIIKNPDKYKTYHNVDELLKDALAEDEEEDNVF